MAGMLAATPGCCCAGRRPCCACGGRRCWCAHGRAPCGAQATVRALAWRGKWRPGGGAAVGAATTRRAGGVLLAWRATGGCKAGPSHLRHLLQVLAQRVHGGADPRWGPGSRGLAVASLHPRTLIRQVQFIFICICFCSHCNSALRCHAAPWQAAAHMHHQAVQARTAGCCPPSAHCSGLARPQWHQQTVPHATPLAAAARVRTPRCGRHCSGRARPQLLRMAQPADRLNADLQQGGAARHASARGQNALGKRSNDARGSAHRLPNWQ